MIETIKVSALGLATLVTILISLACTYWFFYSIMAGGTNSQAIAAGIAGCTVQVFAYTFDLRNIQYHKLLRVGLTIGALAISLLASYSALYSFLSHSTLAEADSGREKEVILGMLEQSSENKKILADAAKQGLKESYRTQAKQFIELSEKSWDKEQKLLRHLEDRSTHQDTRPVTPLNGLLKMTNHEELALILFCAWMAIQFDLYPVIGLNILSMKLKNSTRDALLETAQEQATKIAAMKAEMPADPDITSHGKDSTSASFKSPYGIVKQANDIDTQLIINEITNGSILPTYKAVMDLTGWTKRKTQSFYKACLEQGVLEKEGKGFAIANHVTPITQSKKFAAI